MSAGMLEIRTLGVRYGPFIALQEVSLHVDRGEIVGLIGPNGAGKSSLVRAVAGLVQPSSGEILFEGASLLSIKASDRTRLGLSVVPEGRGLFPQMSVEENLLMGGYAAASSRQMAESMEHCYALFPLLRDRRRQLAGTLSGGQQQMLAICTGLMSRPKLCILDEPSLGLAPIVIGDIGRTLRRLREEGVTVLLAEQNARLTGEVADRIYVLQAGGVRYHDTPDRLLADPEIARSFLTM